MLRKNVVIGFVCGLQQGPMKLLDEHPGHSMILRRPLVERMDSVDQIRGAVQHSHGRIPIVRVGTNP